MRLAGKTALVTGGSRGIGQAIVEKLTKEGARVAFTYVNNEVAAKEYMELLQKKSLDARMYHLDVTNAEQVRELVKQVEKDLGSIDILVNNAGITDDGFLFMMTKEKWDRVIQTNLTGMFHTTKAVLPIMLRQKGGSVINITSVSGIIGTAGQANYAAAKAGIIGLTRSLSKEVAGKNIRVNAVAPGYIYTEMVKKIPEHLQKQFLFNISVKRFGSPEEVANVVSFLASDEASYIVGQTLVVDGGLA